MDKKRPKGRKDLNLFSASDAPFIIKVLTDLENRPNTFFYRHVGPEGPKETTRKKNGSCSGSTAAKPRGGQAPALRFAEHPSPHRSARACPSHALAAKKTCLQVL